MKRVMNRYFLRSGKLARNIVVSVCFAILFLILYTPFSSTAWFNLHDRLAMLLTIGMISTGIVVAIAVKTTIYQIGKKRAMSTAEYTGWNVLEIIIIACIYSFVTATLIERVDIGFLNIFPKGLLITSIVLIVPQTVTHILCWKELKRLESRKNEADKNEIAPRAELIKKDDEIYLREYDLKGVIKLLVPIRDIILFESQDNYVLIYYIIEGNLMKHLLRTRMMTIEDKFTQGQFTRCHRCYIVNNSWIKDIKKDAKNYVVLLKEEQIKPIPVSKKYFVPFTEKLEVKIDTK